VESYLRIVSTKIKAPFKGALSLIYIIQLSEIIVIPYQEITPISCNSGLHFGKTDTILIIMGMLDFQFSTPDTIAVERTDPDVFGNQTFDVFKYPHFIVLPASYYYIPSLILVYTVKAVF
jgi:hypothetical protein